MGFSVEGTGGGGKKKKNLNVELNLIPFIDLMSVNIAFLLITAVWVQVSMIQIGSSLYGKKNDSGQVEQKKDEISLKIDIIRNGYSVNAGKKSLNIPKKDGEYDQLGLLQFLKDFKARNPDKTDGIISLMDDMKYNEMIRAMDALMTAGFPEISVATQGME